MLPARCVLITFPLLVLILKVWICDFHSNFFHSDRTPVMSNIVTWPSEHNVIGCRFVFTQNWLFILDFASEFSDTKFCGLEFRPNRIWATRNLYDMNFKTRIFVNLWMFVNLCIQMQKNIQIHVTFSSYVSLLFFAYFFNKWKKMYACFENFKRWIQRLKRIQIHNFSAEKSSGRNSIKILNFKSSDTDLLPYILALNPQNVKHDVV